MQLIVLGMHRSGTSTVTRLLNMAGAYFGPEGMSNGADEGNPKGFWERVDVRAACDGLLQESGFDWWKVADFSLDRIGEPTRMRHIGNLKRILLELDAHRPWVVKEPRLCLLFPLVGPLLEVPVCIHMTREPLEIADSLHTRNGIPPPAGLALWELYTLRAFQASAGLPRVQVRYEDVMSAPVAELARLVERLVDRGVVGLRMPTEREITAYIDADLYRERRSSGDRRLWMNQQQMELAAALDDGSALDHEVPAEFSQGTRAQLLAFEAADQLQDEVDRLQREADQRESQIKTLRNCLDNVDHQLGLLAGSRTWRIAWGAQAARHRVLHVAAEPASEPLHRVSGLIDRARRQLVADEVPTTPTDPQDVQCRDGYQ